MRECEATGRKGLLYWCHAAFWWTYTIISLNSKR